MLDCSVESFAFRILDGALMLCTWNNYGVGVDNCVECVKGIYKWQYSISCIQ